MAFLAEKNTIIEELESQIASLRNGHWQASRDKKLAVRRVRTLGAEDGCAVGDDAPSFENHDFSNSVEQSPENLKIFKENSLCQIQLEIEKMNKEAEFGENKLVEEQD